MMRIFVLLARWIGIFDSCEEDRGVAKWLVGGLKGIEGTESPAKHSMMRPSIRLIGTATASGDSKVCIILVIEAIANLN